jgi:hypothetical protein
VASADIPRVPGSAEADPPEEAQDVRAVSADEGTGVRFDLPAPDGQILDIVVLTRGPVTWVITLTPNGSRRAPDDFENMLGTLNLPPPAG